MALAALAETHYVGVALVGCIQEPWRAAGLHLAAALPNFLAIEAGELPLDREGYTELPR
jgi:L-alanine-DL-glutamate epimerase-like enolase superfamily enzyme